MIYSTQGFLKRAAEAGRKISQNEKYNFTFEDIIVDDTSFSTTYVAPCGTMRCTSSISPTSLISSYTLELASGKIPSENEFSLLCQAIQIYGFYLKPYYEQEEAYIQIDKHTDLKFAQKDILNTVLILHGRLAYKILANKSLMQLAIEQANPEIFMHLVYIEDFDTMAKDSWSVQDYKPLDELLDELIGISLQDLSLKPHTQWLKTMIKQDSTPYTPIEKDINQGFMKLNIPIKPWIKVDKDIAEEIMGKEYLVDFFPDNKTYSYLPWIITKEGERLFSIHWDGEIVDLRKITSYNTVYCKPCFMDVDQDCEDATIYLNFYTSVLREKDIYTTYLQEYEDFDTEKLLDIVEDNIARAPAIFTWLIEMEYYLGAFWNKDAKSRAYSPSTSFSQHPSAATILAKYLGKSLRDLPANLADLHLALAKALICEYEIGAEEAFLMESSAKEIAAFLNPYFQPKASNGIIHIQD